MSQGPVHRLHCQAECRRDLHPPGWTALCSTAAPTGWPCGLFQMQDGMSTRANAVQAAEQRDERRELVVEDVLEAGTSRHCRLKMTPGS